MAAEKRTINEILGISMEKIKEMADTSAIIGDPITTPDGTTVIPISKVSYGFASGGSDLRRRREEPAVEEDHGERAGREAGNSGL